MTHLGKGRPNSGVQPIALFSLPTDVFHLFISKNVHGRAAILMLCCGHHLQAADFRMMEERMGLAEDGTSNTLL